MVNEDLIHTGHEAKMVWNSKLVRAFMETYVNALFVKWVNASTVEEREQLWAKAKVAEDFKRTFEQAITKGNIEQRKLNGEPGGDGLTPPIV